MSQHPEYPDEPTGQPPPPYGQTPQYGVRPFDAPPGPTPTTAILSLVLGIGSIVLCFGPLAGIPAMILGRKATKEIDASAGALGGRGVATSGFVTGLVGTLLGILLIIGVIGVFALGNAVQDELQETCTTVAGEGC